MATQPEWLKEAPFWFQRFYLNDHAHLVKDMSWMKKIVLLVLAAIVGGYFIG